MYAWGDDINARLQAARDDLGGWATHPDHLLITVPIDRGLVADILQVEGYTPEQVNAFDDRAIHDAVMRHVLERIDPIRRPSLAPFLERVQTIN